MRNLFCYVFIALCFMNTNNAWSAFFYADALESAIQENFSENLWNTVANEYEAQMDASGEISENGLYNVCYAGGADVRTAAGAEKCQAFVKSATDGCVYAKGSGVAEYNNPPTTETKIKRCIFDRTLTYAFGYEGGFQQTPDDPGNRICVNMVPQTDKNGKFLLGATNHGITTCASGLTVNCIKKMSEDQARLYYWTRFYKKYKYDLLPNDVLPAVMELALAGVGVVYKELSSVVGASCSGPVINQCMVDAINSYLDKHTLDEFYNKMADTRAKKRSGKAKQRALGITKLSGVGDECAKLFSK